VFTNEGRVPADLIRFRVDFGNESIAIRDSGIFSPGVTITHVYKHRGGNVYSSPLFAPAKLSCTVDAVHFKDGSDWTPEAAAAAAVHATEVKPIGDGFIGIQMEQTPQGVVARLLFPGGPARTAGMMQGDVLEKIDEQRITNVPDAITLISSVHPGTPLTITVVRDGAERDLTVIVGSHPK
jgi:membrane-associated protease RseP (regulator of RpoE activity)